MIIKIEKIVPEAEITSFPRCDKIRYDLFKTMVIVLLEISTGIIVDQDIKGGKPVIKGTRIPVSFVLDKLSLGLSLEELINEYGLEKDQILNTIKYAAKLLTF